MRLRRSLLVAVLASTLLAAGVGAGAQVAAGPIMPPPAILGDANCDLDVNSLDALLVLQYNAALISSIPCQGDADYNVDGVIDAVDAALILQYEAGLFPV